MIRERQRGCGKIGSLPREHFDTPLWHNENMCMCRIELGSIHIMSPITIVFANPFRTPHGAPFLCEHSPCVQCEINFLCCSHHKKWCVVTSSHRGEGKAVLVINQFSHNLSVSLSKQHECGEEPEAHARAHLLQHTNSPDFMNSIVLLTKTENRVLHKV